MALTKKRDGRGGASLSPSSSAAARLRRAAKRALLAAPWLLAAAALVNSSRAIRGGDLLPPRTATSPPTNSTAALAPSPPAPPHPPPRSRSRSTTPTPNLDPTRFHRSPTDRPPRYWWELSDTCVDVDRACVARGRADGAGGGGGGGGEGPARWFYRRGGSDSGSSSGRAGARRPPFQPELRHMPDSGKSFDPRNRFDVPARDDDDAGRNASAAPACVPSSASTLLILHSTYNYMMGEFYGRTAAGIGNLLRDMDEVREERREEAAAEERRGKANDLAASYKFWQRLWRRAEGEGEGASADARAEEEEEGHVQVLIHVGHKDRGIMDGHRLIVEGLDLDRRRRRDDAAPVGNLSGSGEGVDRRDDEGETESLLAFLSTGPGASPKSRCECFERLVFCGYEGRWENGTAGADRALALWPGGAAGRTPGWNADPNRDDWAVLRSRMAANLDRRHPNLARDVLAFRRAALEEKAFGGAGDDPTEWTFVGLSSRTSRRKWLNLPDALAACDDRLASRKVACVEVNVERARSPYEQLVAHRALDALAGIHGAQMTQAVFLPRRSKVLELLPWWRYGNGRWTQRRDTPTPLGIVYHGTDLDHLGYPLPRSSVPACPDTVGNQTADRECLFGQGTNRRNDWDVRDFTVDPEVILRFVDKFVANDPSPSCAEIRERAENRDQFVLYNVWCGDKQKNSSMTIHHFYQKDDPPRDEEWEQAEAALRGGGAIASAAEVPAAPLVPFPGLGKPYLVVCDQIPGSLLPGFSDSNFVVVRLNKEETPPPWNATAFLNGENCKDHPYVVEAKKRWKESPPLDRSLWPSDTGLLLRGGVRWPDAAGASDVRVVRNRPAMINILGEVFWRRNYGEATSCNSDFVVYREVETPHPCPAIHFLQGVSTTLERGEGDSEFGLIHTTRILTGAVPHPHRPASGATHYPKGFCSFLIRYNSTNPAHMFNHTYYDPDAFVRHMFFLQLSSEYKACQRITECPGSPYTAFHCMVGYKFHVTMENTMVNGYLSEKLFNGALGGGIPVYFGAPDVGHYVNSKSFVHCNVSRTIIEEMRAYYPRRPRPRPWLFERKNFTTPWPTDEELLKWADKYLRPQLEPCVRQVVELDQDDDAYRAMLQEPFITYPGIMAGEYPLRGTALAYNVLRGWEKTAD